jgi:hypothetical protein
MRFISKFGSFGLLIKRDVTESYATGLTRTIEEPVYAIFSPGGLRPEERALAIGHWSFNGLPQEQDETTTVQPDYRIGLFDTHIAQMAKGWDDETTGLVERTLVERAAFNDDILLIEEIRAVPPWPRYDAYQGGTKALMRKLVDEGHDLEQVLAYESENQQRSDVLLALEDLLADPEQLAELQPEVEEVVG